MKKLFAILGGVMVGLVAAGLIHNYTGNGWAALAGLLLPLYVAAK